MANLFLGLCGYYILAENSSKTYTPKRSVNFPWSFFPVLCISTKLEPLKAMVDEHGLTDSSKPPVERAGPGLFYPEKFIQLRLGGINMEKLELQLMGLYLKSEICHPRAGGLVLGEWHPSI